MVTAPRSSFRRHRSLRIDGARRAARGRGRGRRRAAGSCALGSARRLRSVSPISPRADDVDRCAGQDVARRRLDRGCRRRRRLASRTAARAACTASTWSRATSGDLEQRQQEQHERPAGRARARPSPARASESRAADARPTQPRANHHPTMSVTCLTILSNRPLTAWVFVAHTRTNAADGRGRDHHERVLGSRLSGFGAIDAIDHGNPESQEQIRHNLLQSSM